MVRTTKLVQRINMKTLILSLLFSFNLFAATGIPSGGGTAIINNTITVAGKVINLSDPNVITATTHHNAANTYDTATIQQPSGTGIFAQVPVGKKWTLLAFTANNGQAAANNYFLVGWGTGTEVDNNDPVSVPEYFCGGITNPVERIFVVNSDREPSQKEFTCPMIVPANGYPFTRHTSTGNGLNVTLYFLEEDA